MPTMDDRYGDGSEHEVCTECGLCIDCEDCDCTASTQQGVYSPIHSTPRWLRRLAGLVE